jgi:hypothetical protein
MPGGAGPVPGPQCSNAALPAAKERDMQKNIPTALPEFDDARILERPDGFYWQLKATGEEFGPFASLDAAIVDIESSVDDVLETGETLAEAEAELGIADWIDPDTGVPAEEGVPRLEDH